MTVSEWSGPIQIRVGAETSDVDLQFRKQVVQLLRDTSLNLCYQCGVCTGSCPTADKMRYGPRKIMHMVHLGIVDRALRSPDIWYCVSCYSCSVRCPQGVPVSDVMSVLRNMSIEQGLAEDNEATFSQLFLRILEEHGRMYEPEVMLRYFSSVLDVDAMVKIMPLGISMYLKSKIGLLPERIRNPRELTEIHQSVSGGKVL